jgi:hypothetical protein
MFEGPEKKFQRHIADYFIREHRYALLGQDEITVSWGRTKVEYRQLRHELKNKAVFRP